MRYGLSRVEVRCAVLNASVPLLRAGIDQKELASTALATRSTVLSSKRLPGGKRPDTLIQRGCRHSDTTWLVHFRKCQLSYGQLARRLHLALLSPAVCERACGFTQTWSCALASRHTKPCRQVSGPYGPPFGERREAAWALSAATWFLTSGVTQTRSPRNAFRQTKP